MQDSLKNKYLAFVLSEVSRAELIKEFPAAYDRIIAHHVTIQFNVNEDGMKLLNGPAPIVKAVAYGKNDKVDCVLVNVNRTCMRLDGSFYHVTISCSPIGKPVDSNAFLKLNHGLEGALNWSHGPVILEGKLELLNK